jgi:2-iminobutanoate/2-iminopropanoate deaminase
MSNRELFVVPGIGNPQWYSGASRFGDLIWTAGQVPARADGTMPEDFAEQVAVTLDNLEATLRHVGGSFATLLKINAYLTSLDDFPVYNQVYTERLAAHGLPPRTTVEIVRFPSPMKIEIEAVAHVEQPAS